MSEKEEKREDRWKKGAEKKSGGMKEGIWSKRQ